MATDKQSAEKEITVEEKLSTLYQLQTMMTEIDKIKTLRGELPLEVQDLEDEIAGLETRLQNYQSEIKDFENAVVEQKHKITESTGLIEKYKAQLDNVRNNREFDNLSKEIEFQGLEIEFSERRFVNSVKRSTVRRKRSPNCPKDWKAVRLIWFKSRVNWNRSFPKPSRTKRNCAKSKETGGEYRTAPLDCFQTYPQGGT